MAYLVPLLVMQSVVSYSKARGHRKRRFIAGALVIIHDDSVLHTYLPTGSTLSQEVHS